MSSENVDVSRKDEKRLLDAWLSRVSFDRKFRRLPRLDPEPQDPDDET